MKTVVYGATRNLYRNLIPCINSVLKNGNIDEVVLLIENDTYPYKLPNKVRTINVSEQKWISERSPNYYCRWTYMVMMKLAVSKIFPDYDRVLYLDTDTIVEADLSPLWDIDLTDYWYAAVRQPDRSTDEYCYINAGVLLCNLDKLRRDKKDDELLQAVNTYIYRWVEQDCISERCQGGILPLKGRYNRSDFTENDSTYVIRHFAANREWRHTAIAQIYDAEEIIYG